MPQLRFDMTDSPWCVTRDGDADARALYLRHYTNRKRVKWRDSALFIGPGGKLVLLTSDGKALFAWRRFIDDADTGRGRQAGVNCAVFRNEGPALSSELILAAEPFAWDRWPNEVRVYTYVDPGKVRRKRDPGRCFRRAGWRPCGTTKAGQLVLEKFKGEQA